MSTKEPISKSHAEEALKALFADVFQQISRRRAKPEVNVTFYPFAGLNHTIRIRNQRVYVRVSDILRNAPPPVHQALAHILVGKLFNQRPKVEYEALYRQYAYQPQILRASDLARQRRGRKQLNGSVGRAYDLGRVFARLNRRYFGKARPELERAADETDSWSSRRCPRCDCHQPFFGSGLRPGLCRRICDVPRDAAHQTQTACGQRAAYFSYARVSRGRETLCLL
jgi:hypothetical protein